MRNESDEGSAVELGEVPQLLASAFAAARAKGKPEWRRMTTAVLKNRLLQATERRFDVEALGFASLQHLLAEFPSLVRIDHTTSPATVEYLGEVAPTPREQSGTRPVRTRVRDDLWQAVLNYSAGHVWVWDSTASVARVPLDSDENALVVPTIQREEFAEIRAGFVAQVAASIGLEELQRLERWSTEGLGTAELPPTLRGQWNGFVRAIVVERLTDWFESEGIEVPPDLLLPDAPTLSQPADAELMRLRALVIDCVRSMTLSELAGLNLPAGAVLRSRPRQPGAHGD